VPDGERRAHVLAEVELLEGDRAGGVGGQQLLDLLIDIGQPALARDPRRRLDHAPVESAQPTLLQRHHAVAGAGEARIYAEDDHAQ
jgi:hypothetical protein